jgi:GH18 family chitinase
MQFTESGNTETDYKIVCYLSSWAKKRPNPMNFYPSLLDANKCTHVIYAFAGIDENSYEISVADETTDITEGKSIIICYYVQMTMSSIF